MTVPVMAPMPTATVEFPRKRVKVPSVLQMEETECGAASLGMVLAHFGRYVPLEELREACGVSRDGSKAPNMLRAARGYGLTAQGYRRTFPTLGDSSLPTILFWRFSHWVVLEGFRPGALLINDPAEGRRAVPLDEAQRSFSGVTLQFEPGPDFQPGGSRPRWVRDLLSRMRIGTTGFVLAAIAGLFLVVPGILVPLFTTVFVDTVITPPEPGRIGGLLIAVAATMLMMGLLTLVQQWFLANLQTRLTVSGSYRLVDHLLHLPVQFFTQRFPGVLVGRLDQVDSISGLIAGPLVTSGVSLVGLIGYAVVMVTYSPVLTAVGIVAGLLNVVALVFVSRQRDAANQLQLRESSRLSGLGMSTVASIESVKTSGAEDAAFERWAGFQARYLTASQQMGRLTNGLSVVPTTLSSITSVLVLCIGGLQVMSGALTLGLLVGFQSLMASFLAPISQLVGLASQAQTAQGQLVQINDVMSNPVADQFGRPDGDLLAGGATRLDGRLELIDVEFGYARSGPPLISGFSLTIEPGQRVALVGGTGSGKTTIVRLIMGLYQPWSGQIRFDGRPREEWDRSLITTSVAYVDQQIMLFEGTIEDNLTMWDRSMPQADVIAAARDACIHDDIAGRTGGYQSPVEEDGRNFSGGQRQRLEIARALALDPSIVVLDEATSALDTATEQRIDRRLRARGATSLIIAHRLSTIRDCDEIIVLDAGRIVQRGTHDRLIAEGGRYATLIEAE
jgi:NHLM bacteriocin system ABC transporter peptidase/ATP-binding protein